MCEDYPCCGHDSNDCPEQSMEVLYDWSMEDEWDEPLTPEEQAAADRAEAQNLHLEMLGEMYNAQYAFD